MRSAKRHRRKQVDDPLPALALLAIGLLLLCVAILGPTLSVLQRVTVESILTNGVSVDMTAIFLSAGLLLVSGALTLIGLLLLISRV